MERKIIQTSDGSKSLYLPQLDETYHSRHGALQEAFHVFIRSGLDLFPDGSEISIFEMGFGTGLNALITALEARSRRLSVRYSGLEAYPVSWEEARSLDYPVALGNANAQSLFEKLHTISWGETVALNDNFKLNKIKGLLTDFDQEGSYDLIYFDAFGPRVQPELWTEAVFEKMYRALKSEGVLVTYSAKGSVRRAMQAVGFEVERLPGPPGKREMLRATKDAELL